MTSLRAASVALVLVVFLTLVPRSVHGQFRPGAGGGGAPGWAPAAIGVRVGFDNTQSEPMVGALTRIPVLPNGTVELLSSADITFLPDFKEYQVNFELVYLTAGRRGGLYFGGGMGLRNGLFSPDPNAPRRYERTFSLVAGVRLGGLGRFRPEVETRWILQDEQVRDPRLVAFGVSMALW